VPRVLGGGGGPPHSEKAEKKLTPVREKRGVVRDNLGGKGGWWGEGDPQGKERKLSAALKRRGIKNTGGGGKMEPASTHEVKHKGTHQKDRSRCLKGGSEKRSLMRARLGAVRGKGECLRLSPKGEKMVGVTRRTT